MYAEAEKKASETGNDGSADVNDPEKLDYGQMPHHIYIASRDPGNKALYWIYRLFRMILISGWFYFLPFVIMFASYIIPAYYKN